MYGIIYYKKGMKRLLIILTLLLLVGGANAQNRKAKADKPSISFEVAECSDSILYIGRHYRDELQLVDSMQRDAKKPVYALKGQRSWQQRGIYALVRQDRKTVLTDFIIDDSRVFSLTGDASMSAHSIKVKGSAANQVMFDYMATQHAARHEADSLRSINDQAGLDKLAIRMDAYEKRTMADNKENLFLQLVALCEAPTVDDTVADKALYYRTHYWNPLFDGVEESKSRRVEKSESKEAISTFNFQLSTLLYSPQLFSKMNTFFFGLLYHAEADTIAKEIDRLMARIGNDTAMARYVLQFIEPRYYRSTRNIGWDAVWCHIAQEYILKGRCPWMRESELYLALQNHRRISQSIIGAHGKELWMLDTTQIDAPEHWQSSHRQNARYVILWFWDPDCHHCQEQSAELKVLYDSLSARGEKRFEVYAVGYESDVDKWKRYVHDHEFRWVNVGGPQVNIDYQEAYNVHGAPTMIILNERRDIIMNKVLPVSSLLPFLDNYEKKR